MFLYLAYHAIVCNVMLEKGAFSFLVFHNELNDRFKLKWNNRLKKSHIFDQERCGALRRHSCTTVIRYFIFQKTMSGEKDIELLVNIAGKQMKECEVLVFQLAT
jgi:hypothetical protein